MTQRLVLLARLAGRAGEIDVLHLPYPTQRETAPTHSDTGELPVLRLDGAPTTAVVEHAAEYLDRRFAAGLLPDDPGERLPVRGAERAVGAALDALRHVFTARDSDALAGALADWFGHLARLEARLPAHRPGDLTRMDLVALAPMASLLDGFPGLRDHRDWVRAPRVRAHLAACADSPEVAASRCPDYVAKITAFFAMTGSAFPRLSA